MTHLTNDAETFKDDLVDGLVAAYSRYVERVPDASGVQRRGGPVPGKVSLIIGGGSGHYPAFAGTVGAGMAAAAVVGDVFTSPSTEQAYRVGRALDGGAGVLFSFGNYAGDVMNFGVAEQRLRADGIDCRTVLVTDDVASAEVGELDKRRGIAGDFVVFKVAGAAAERGDDLDAVERVARHANDRTRTLGVAFAGCTVPGADEPLFTVEAGQMEVGLGIHGEPGVSTSAMVSARELVPMLLDPLLEERPDGADGRVAVIVNGLGATKYEELFCLSASLFPALAEAGLDPVLPEVGELVTSLDMAGCSLTLCWLDDELEELWAAPADTPAFRRGDVQRLDPAADDPQTPAVQPQAHGQADSTAEAEPDDSALACATTVRTALRAMRDVVVDGERELGNLDAVAGDGDHGSGMARGLRAAVEAGDAAAGGPATVLRDAGAALADKAGGTSGVLWGAMLTAVGDRIGNETAPDDDTLVAGIRDATRLCNGWAVASPATRPCSMPCSPSPRRSRSGSRPVTPAAAWSAAAARADEAAQATAELTAKVGRARPLAERGIGTPDPGAVSMAWCLEAVAGRAGQASGRRPARRPISAWTSDVGHEGRAARRVGHRAGRARAGARAGPWCERGGRAGPRARARGDRRGGQRPARRGGGRRSCPARAGGRHRPGGRLLAGRRRAPPRAPCRLVAGRPGRRPAGRVGRRRRQRTGLPAQRLGPVPRRPGPGAGVARPARARGARPGGDRRLLQGRRVRPVDRPPGHRPSDSSVPFGDGTGLGYSDQILQLCGLEHRRDLLAPIEAPGPQAAVTAAGAELAGLAAGTPVVSGPFDFPACAFGAGVDEPGDGLLIVGTTLGCLVNVDHLQTAGEPAGFSVSTGRPERWLRAMPAMVGTASMDWMLKTWASASMPSSRAGRQPARRQRRRGAPLLRDARASGHRSSTRTPAARSPACG